jgi:hypothetical protein
MIFVMKGLDRCDEIDFLCIKEASVQKCTFLNIKVQSIIF